MYITKYLSVSCLYFFILECKSKLVADLVGRFEHPGAAGGYRRFYQEPEEAAQRCEGFTCGFFSKRELGRV